MGFGRMKREANRDRETFGGEKRMDEREMEEAREIETGKGTKRRKRKRRWRRWRRYGRKANERVVP